MLTKQGNTQVYSPFGTYVVEQHGNGCGRLESPPEPDFAAVTEQQPARPATQDLKKAA